MTRFRLDSATAGEVMAYAERICYKYDCGGWFEESSHRGGDTSRDEIRQGRAVRLLLHWWAVGHDPARAIRNRKVGER